MPRSLKVQQSQLGRVKLALHRNGYPSQRAIAEEVGLSLATVNNFLTGKPVDYTTFEELSRQLGLEWKDIANLDFETQTPTKPQTLEFFDTEPDNSPPYPNGAVPLGSPFYLERKPVEAQIKQEIRKPGTLIRIKAPREMGKTSLLLRILEFAKTPKLPHSQPQPRSSRSRYFERPQSVFTLVLCQYCPTTAPQTPPRRILGSRLGE